MNYINYPFPDYLQAAINNLGWNAWRECKTPIYDKMLKTQRFHVNPRVNDMICFEHSFHKDWYWGKITNIYVDDVLVHRKYSKYNFSS